MATIRQKKAAEIAAKKLKKGGKRGKTRLSKKEILLEAGYDEDTAKTPEKVFGTKGFKELLDEYLPEEDILSAVQKLVNAEVIIRTKKSAGGAVIYEEERLDSNAVAKGADMAIKLRGLYAAKKVQVVDPLDEMADDELDREIAELERARKERLKKKPKVRGKVTDAKKR